MASGQVAMVMSRWRASPESIGGPWAGRSRARPITLVSGRLAREVPVELRGRPAVSSLSFGGSRRVSRLAQWVGGEGDAVGGVKNAVHGW